MRRVYEGDGYDGDFFNEYYRVQYVNDTRAIYFTVYICTEVHSLG